MKRFNIFYLVAFTILLLVHLNVFERKNKDVEEIKTTDIMEVTIVEKDTIIDDWDIFIKALIWVESKGNKNAIGTKNDVGVIQITPIFLKDANRIVGYDKYKLSDRKDSLMSIEMFNVIQEHYNPMKDKHLALKIHNSKAPVSYHTKVMNKYLELKENN